MSALASRRAIGDALGEFRLPAKTPGYVQLLGANSTGAGTNASSIVATLTKSMAAGNAIIVAIRNGSSTAVNTVTDSRGNTYTKAKEEIHGSVASLWHCLSPVTPLQAGDTVTASWTGSINSNAILVQEYAGLLSLDQVGGNGSTTAATSGSATSGTTTAANEVAIALLVTGNTGGAGSGAWTATAPFTARDANPNAPILAHTADETGVGSGVTVSPAFTWTNNQNWAIVVATYKTS